MSGVTVHFERTTGIAELVLTRPDRSNALDLATARQLATTLAHIAEHVTEHEDLHVLLIRAEGRNFCVGGDIHAFAAHDDGLADYVAQVATAAHEALNTCANLPIPVIAAVHGAVAGAGIGLAFNADLVYLAESATMQLAYTAIGLSPDNGASWLPPRLIGPRRTLELALTNRTLTAADCVKWGLATTVVHDHVLLNEARRAAAQLNSMSTDALIVAKRLIHGSTEQASLRLHLEQEAEAISVLAATPNTRQAIQHFAAAGPNAEQTSPTHVGRPDNPRRD